MNLWARLSCMELLLDLICYEMHRGKITPEMRRIFEEHIDGCPSCRNQVFGFFSMLDETRTHPNFG